MVYCEQCGEVPVPESDLPVELPEIQEIKIGEQSPLALIGDFVNTKCPKCQGAAMRETDTMDGFVDNSWYFFRYLDPNNTKEFAAKDRLNHWMPVDLYVGGVEHAVGLDVEPVVPEPLASGVIAPIGPGVRCPLSTPCFAKRSTAGRRGRRGSTQVAAREDLRAAGARARSVSALGHAVCNSWFGVDRSRFSAEPQPDRVEGHRL